MDFLLLSTATVSVELDTESEFLWRFKFFGAFKLLCSAECA